MDRHNDGTQAPGTVLEESILNLLRERLALTPNEIAAALDMEEPDARRQELTLALRRLEKSLNLLHDRHRWYYPCLPDKDVIAVLNRTGGCGFTKLVQELSAAKGMHPALVRLTIRAMKQRGSILCHRDIWYVRPPLSEESILALPTRAFPGSAWARKTLCRYFGISRTDRAGLNGLLQRMEQAGRISSWSGLWALCGPNGEDPWAERRAKAAARKQKLKEERQLRRRGALLSRDDYEDFPYVCGNPDADLVDDDILFEEWSASGLDAFPDFMDEDFMDEDGDENDREDDLPAGRSHGRRRDDERGRRGGQRRHDDDAVPAVGVYAPTGSSPVVVLDEPVSGSDRCIVSNLCQLLPGDRVEVLLEGGRSRRFHKCSVTRILKYSEDPLLLEVEDGRPLMGRPVDGLRCCFHGALVIERNEPGARPMDRVQARVLHRGRDRVAVAVERVLFRFYSIEGQEELARLNHRCPGPFPDACLQEAATLEEAVFEPGAGADWRALPFVTMDGDTARDYDDAIQVERTGHGFILRVAIADVSRYVRHGSAMDREALERGCTRYFPTSMAPMLPERLCTDLCSLVPRRDRPVMWAELDLRANGSLRQAGFGQGFIRSHARLTYDQAKALVLDRDPAALAAFHGQCPEAEHVLAMLKDAHACYLALAARRRERGSLDLDLPDIETRFDGGGSIVKLARARRHDMHRLIEEFMIRANEAVAEFLLSCDMPTLYRNHPAPADQDVKHFLHMLRLHRLPVPGSAEGPRGGRRAGAAEGISLGGILDGLKGHPMERIVARMCVRSMPRARYDEENFGHFGLASTAYCHFTSPIRRYADLVVHRSLKAALGLDAGPIRSMKRLSRAASIINEQEQATQECEREMRRRCACMWLSARPRNIVWNAVVSGVRQTGCFVELDAAPVEGFVPVHLFKRGRRVIYSEKDECLSIQGARSVRMGTRLKVMVDSINPVSLYINFKPVQGGD